LNREPCTCTNPATLLNVQKKPEPGDILGPDGERLVDFADDDPVLPGSTRDETDAGWGERTQGNDDWLVDERPPHWD